MNPDGWAVDVTVVSLTTDATSYRPLVRRHDTFVDEYEDLFRAAYRVAYRLLGDRQEAEDIAQESCIRACQRWKRLSNEGYAKPWVVRVATNLALDRWRRVKVAARNRQRPADAIQPADALRIDLHRALESLPKRQREAVVLRYIADLPEPQVARVLNCSPGTVKTHVARGLAALRHAMRERQI